MQLPSSHRDGGFTGQKAAHDRYRDTTSSEETADMDHQIQNGRTFRMWRVIYALCLMDSSLPASMQRRRPARQTRVPLLALCRDIQTQFQALR